MKGAVSCNQCGQALPEGGADAACPACLLAWGLGNGAEEPAAPFSEGVSPNTLGDLASPGRLARFGDYELLGEIARGGMGVVYKARQVSLNRTVAIKVILAGHFADKGARQRFKTEAEAAARLRHPNIVGIHEVGQHEGFPYFSMDYIEGGNLGQAAKARSVSPRLAATWVKTAAEAIHYAHQQGVLHRDIKPSNILIDPLAVAHVTDFGLAKQVESSVDLTVSGEILGSPNYMPPEQAGGSRGQAGPASDIYSLGAVLYELLTGRPPFLGGTLAETVHHVIHQEVTAPSLLNPGVPADLETLCLKCLEKEPQRRYASAEELAQELGRFLGDEPILARPIGGFEKARRWCRRKPAIAALAASLVLVFALGLTGVLTELFHVRAKNAQILRDSARLHVLTGVQLMQDGDYFKSLLWFAQALDIDKAIPARKEIHEMRFAAVLAQCPKLVQVISHDRQPIVSAVFSPTDDRLATIGADRTARVWEIPGGRLLMKTNLAALPFGIAFSPDSARLVVVLMDNTVRVLDAATGEQALPALPHSIESGGKAPFLPVFDPGGKMLITQPKQNELQVWEAGTGKPMGARIMLTNHLERVQFSSDGAWLFTQADGNSAWNARTGERVDFPVSGPDALGRFYFSQGNDLAGSDGRIWRIARRFGDSGATPGWRTNVVSGLGLEPGFLAGQAFSPPGDRLVTGSLDRTARIWDTRTGAPLTPPLPHDQAVAQVAFSPEGRRVLTVAEDNTARIWDADTGQPLTPPISHAGTPGVSTPSLLSGSGRYLVTLHPAFAACVWDLRQRDSPPVLLRPLKGGELSEPASQGGHLVTRDANNLIRVRSIMGDSSVPLHPSSLKTTTRQWWPDASNRFLIIEGEMGRVQVWDNDSGTPITPQTQSRYSLDDKDCRTVKLPLAGLTAPDALELAQLVSGSRLDGTGGWTSLTFEELTAAWARLTQKHPELLCDREVDPVTWQRHEARAAEAACDWQAASFHWEKLRLKHPEEIEYAERHRYAQACLAQATAAAKSYSDLRRAVPPRDPRADERTIDLAASYTDPVPEGLPCGVWRFGGVSFDVRGRIELFGRQHDSRGSHHPEQVGIVLRKCCRELHFLHTAYWAESIPGAEVATVVAKYTNGQTERIVMQDLVQVANDQPTQPFKPSAAEVVWIGTNPLVNARRECVRVFNYSWKNPHPDWEISGLELRSAKSNASYLLLALTRD